MGAGFPSEFSEKEIQKLYLRFKDIDKNGNGDLDPEQFFAIAEINQNPLVKRVIQIFDVDKNGTISFAQFLSGKHALTIGLSKLYNNNEEEKIKFAFRVYDLDEDGYISNGELFKVLKMMVGNNLNDIQLQQLVDRTIIQADTVILI